MNVHVEPPGELARSPWQTAKRWLDEFGQVALATVVATWGSAPVPAGGQLVVGPGERFEGSVSGGCVEVDVIVEANDAMAAGKPRLLEYGVSDEAAWRAGLACGGTVKVFVQPLTRADVPMVDAIIAAMEARTSLLVVTRVADGERHVYEPGNFPAEFDANLSSGATSLVDTPDGQVVAQPLLPPLRVVVAGATHIGQVFAQMARLVGYNVMVVDPRSMFANEDRFGNAVAMVGGSDASFDNVQFDERTALVALTHAAHIDDEALAAALRSPCVYIGALGSRGTNAKRLERLKAAGFTDEQLKRIHAPVGLNIGAKGPAEIAVSILAEIVKVTRGGA
jgi:xanthine dehydrogenase accessory factor